MREYTIAPEFRYSKFFPFLAILHQIAAIGFLVFGYFITPVGFILTILFLLCSLYYIGLSLCTKFYQVHVSLDLLTVRNIINKRRIYHTDKLWWKILKLPWYNTYYILLYSSKQVPIAIVRPHWPNSLRILKFPHLGKFSADELVYLKFLKRVGLLQ